MASRGKTRWARELATRAQSLTPSSPAPGANRPGTGHRVGLDPQDGCRAADAIALSMM
jgi:hypothetical protein